MKLEKVLLLGDPRLHERSQEIKPDEVSSLAPVIEDLHDILFEFKAKYGAGRAIAAPQIGCMKRLIYMNIDKPVIFINPVLSEMSREMFELWDDCMCFPNLHVRVKRHKSCRITFFDENWQKQELFLEDSLSELLQHEYDHLDGILATQRAIDSRSLRLIKN